MTNQVKLPAAPKKKSKEFKKLWKIYIPGIFARKNFQPGHLNQLSILIDLLIDYDKLTIFIEENGYTYEGDGRYGESHKPYPQIAIRQKAITEIRSYSKQLDIVLTKDTTIKVEDEDDWA